LLSETLLKFVLKQRNERLLPAIKLLPIMKRTISLLSVLTFLLAFSGSAFAQTATTNLTANAQVATNISASQVSGGDLNFGIISSDFENQTNAPTVKPDGTTQGIVDASNAQPGLVDISGQSGQTVTVSINNATLDLTESGGSGDVVTLTPTFNYTKANGTSGSLVLGSDIDASNKTSFDVTIDSNDGENTIVVGGSLSENKSGQLTGGSYTGTLPLNLDYSI